jgi:hypothetical protein
VSLIAAVRDLFGRQAATIAALEQRVAVLERRPVGLLYRGVWSPDVAYERDEAVTAGGALWVARTPSRGLKPGEAVAAWQLAVKRGRDGRDGRDAR